MLYAHGDGTVRGVGFGLRAGQGCVFHMYSIYSIEVRCMAAAAAAATTVLACDE